LGERTIRVCDGCQVEEEDLERVKAEWGTWYRPKNKGGASRLDFCGICASGTEDAILKYASVMATRNGYGTRLDSDDEDEDEGTPVVDEILDKRERTSQMPRDGPILTKEDRARLAALKAAAGDNPESRPAHASGPGKAQTEIAPVRKL
jgi:hypothetical protein